jgi:hypothetical protein
LLAERVSAGVVSVLEIAAVCRSFLEGGGEVDPNANLAEVRALVRELTEDEDKSWPFDQDDVSRLLELVFALDDWMSHGGFLPEAWDR